MKVAILADRGEKYISTDEIVITRIMGLNNFLSKYIINGIHIKNDSIDPFELVSSNRKNAISSELIFIMKLIFFWLNIKIINKSIVIIILLYVRTTDEEPVYL